MAIDLSSDEWQPAEGGQAFAFLVTRLFAQQPGASARISSLAQRPEVARCQYGGRILRCLQEDTEYEGSARLPWPVVDYLGRSEGVLEAMIEVLDIPGRTNLKELAWQPKNNGLAFGYFVTRTFARMMPRERIEELAKRPEMMACPHRDSIVVLLKGGCHDGFSQFCALDEIHQCTGVLAAMVQVMSEPHSGGKLE